jgi:hypothetical protein
VLSVYERKNRKNDPASKAPPRTFSQRGNKGHLPARPFEIPPCHHPKLERFCWHKNFCWVNA